MKFRPSLKPFLAPVALTVKFSDPLGLFHSLSVKTIENIAPPYRIVCRLPSYMGRLVACKHHPDY